MRRDLRDRVIVITGASSGIGAATALACAEAGMDVALAARRVDKLEQVAQRIGHLGRRALVVSCDVDRDEDVNRLVERTVNEFGRLDVMFANAGYGLFAPVLETTDAQARAIFETNFYGTIRCLRAAVPVMLRQEVNQGLRGHVLICSSAASELSLPLYGYYAATKAAQDSIAGALRIELRSRAVYVTSVHPIGTRTDFFDRASERAGGKLDLNAPMVMLRRPETVAGKMVRCLRRPRPEVWGSTMARLGLGLATAFPPMAVFIARRLYRRHRRLLDERTDKT